MKKIVYQSLYGRRLLDKIVEKYEKLDNYNYQTFLLKKSDACGLPKTKNNRKNTMSIKHVKQKEKKTLAGTATANFGQKVLTNIFQFNGRRGGPFLTPPNNVPRLVFQGGDPLPLVDQ